MSAFHNIFCTSASPMSTADIARYCNEGWYGDGDPTFSPTPGPDSGWQRMEMRLPGIARPIIFLHDAGDAIRTYVDEALTERSPLPAGVADALRATRQVIGIELWPEALDDDAWELLDQVQAFIATQLNGVLITDDGIYDNNLQVIS